MPPLHMRTTSPQGMLHKNMGSLSISTQSLEHQSSSIYSPATSVGSSSPESNIEMANHLSENENGHDSDSMSEDMNQEFQSPLEQLRSFALKNNGDISQGYSYHNASSLLNASADQLLSAEESYRQFETGGYLECHVCKYVASTQEELMKHVDNHFPFKCSYCNYTARTEGRLKHHESKFHSQTPPECWTGNKRRRIQEDEQTRDVSPIGSKARVTKCKLCNFVGSSKVEYYDHLKQNHTDTAKLLYCDQCRFVTPYKHHLEYHLRNHFGSKPFKCSKCNYKCVNQSMLNSHQKSHSNVYQFRCANCSYATKYCHSLKTHLKKYNHTPGPVLNADGTPNSNSIIDIHGRRRGPKPKRRKNQPEVNPSQLARNSPPTTHANNFPPTTNAQPILYHPNIFNNFAGTMYPMDNANCVMFPPNPYMRKDNCQPTLKCHYCDFTTESQVSYHQHLFLHVARDNSDLMMRYNLNADMYQMHTPQFNYNYVTNGNKFAQGNIARFEPAQESIPRFQQSTQGNIPMTKSIADEPKIDDVLITEPSTEVVKVEPVPRPSCAPGNTLASKKASDQNGNAENPLDLSNKSPSSMDKLEEAISINVPINYTDNLNTDVKRENDTNPARNRRKGKAFKLNHYLQDEEQQFSESYNQSKMSTNGSFTHQDMKDLSAPKSITEPNRKQNSPVLLIKENAREEETESSYSSEVYRCSFCDIIFGDSKMYNKHKAYHSPGDPFTCGLCGVKCRDRVTLFDHFTFVPHFK